MRKVIIKISILITIVIILTLGWIFRPYAQADSSKIESMLSQLSTPYKYIDTYYFKDGGSVGIKIEGRKGNVFLACFPAPLDDNENRYQKLFIGASHYNDENAIELQDSNTKLKLLTILRNRNNNKLYDDNCIAHASGRWRDYWTIIAKKYLLKVDKYSNY